MRSCVQLVRPEASEGAGAALGRPKRHRSSASPEFCSGRRGYWGNQQRRAHTQMQKRFLRSVWVLRRKELDAVWKGETRIVAAAAIPNPNPDASGR